MATLLELATLPQQPGWDALIQKIVAACAIKAHAIAAKATPTAAELTWAKATFQNPRAQADVVAFYAIAATQVATPSVTVAQILNAADGAIQTNVNAAVDNLLGK